MLYTRKRTHQSFAVYEYPCPVSEQKSATKLRHMCSCHEQIFSDANGRLADKGQHFHLRTILSRDKRNLEDGDGGWTDTGIIYVSKLA